MPYAVWQRNCVPLHQERLWLLTNRVWLCAFGLAERSVCYGFIGLPLSLALAADFHHWLVLKMFDDIVCSLWGGVGGS